MEENDCLKKENAELRQSSQKHLKDGDRRLEVEKEGRKKEKADLKAKLREAAVEQVGRKALLDLKDKEIERLNRQQEALFGNLPPEQPMHGVTPLASSQTNAN